MTSDWSIIKIMTTDWSIISILSDWSVILILILICDWLSGLMERRCVRR